jgi:hypothetical protein
MENFEKLDIDRESCERDQFILPTPDQLTTFGEMLDYLKTRPNCRVNCEHFFVIDLHLYLKSIEGIIETIPKPELKKSKEAKRIKETLKIVVKNYIEGKTQPAGTLNKTNLFSNYNN